MNLQEYSHHRRNALTGEWVLVSPHRAKRPWQGQTETAAQTELSSYEDGCYLCPNNSRVNGVKNPDYKDTFIFENDYPAISPLYVENDAARYETLPELLTARMERGICRVICFSPRHDLTLADMPVSQVARLINVWNEQTEALGSLEGIRHVQLFENRGELMGCSNPHPHAQIWAGNHVPQEAGKELREQGLYYKRHGRPLLADYIALESGGKRIVYSNRDFVALVPFWASWPFETLIAPRLPHLSLATLSRQECFSLAEALQKVVTLYNNLFKVPFPYSMGLHAAPYDGEDHPETVFHLHFYPPLLRSATVRKFMVGYELLAMPQRDLTPEQAAKSLREAA